MLKSDRPSTACFQDYHKYTVMTCIHMQTPILLPFALEDSIETHVTIFDRPFLCIHIQNSKAIAHLVASEFVSQVFSF